MNRLELWKKVSPLSVDEFMCLLFGLEPGTMAFDYGDPKDWPENADLVYRMLTADIQARKLCVLFEDIDGDPFRNGAYDRFYADNDNPWWAECDGINSIGKIHRRAFVKWLAEKNIPSDFFDVVPSPSVSVKPENRAEPTRQAPAQVAVNEASPQNVSSAPETHYPSVVGEQRTRIHVNVPNSLWAGKAPQAIFDYLSQENFAAAVIAYILMEKDGGVTKTDAGRMFCREAIDKGIEQDPRTYQRKIDDLLKEAKSKYSFAFHD